VTTSSYTFPTVDTFHIAVEEGITTVMVGGSFTPEKYPALYQLCFAVYSAVVLTIDYRDRDKSFYTIAQQEPQVDLDWLLVALSRFEEGWMRQGNTLFSPNPSNLSQRQIIETFGAAKLVTKAGLSQCHST
jgi:hypothetical protein